MPTPARSTWLVRLCRDDSLTPVIYEGVKHVFWTANNTVLSIAQNQPDGSHGYYNWPRERFTWYTVEREVK
jgi:hypothetical protein